MISLNGSWRRGDEIIETEYQRINRVFKELYETLTEEEKYKFVQDIWDEIQNHTLDQFIEFQYDAIK